MQDIEQLKLAFIGQIVSDIEYDDEDKYYILTFEGGAETSIRFMADIVREDSE